MCYSIALLLVDFMSLRHFIADFIHVLTSAQQIEASSEKFRSSSSKRGESSTLWGMHTRICLRSTICICYNCHIYSASFIKIYRSRLQSPFALCFQQISVPSSPVTFSPSSNQKSWERPSLQPNQTYEQCEPLSTSSHYECQLGNCSSQSLSPRK